jgi:leucyl-tRNA synthetase
MYELFIGPFDQPAAWGTNGISGTKKFLEKVIKSFSPRQQDSGADLDQLCISITDRLENNTYNTAISDFMKFANDVDLSKLSQQEWIKFLTLLSPFAPHLSEYLNLKISDASVFTYSWPDAKITRSSEEYTIQENGKKRGTLVAHVNNAEEEIVSKAKALDNVSLHLQDKQIKKTIFIKGKVINFVV